MFNLRSAFITINIALSCLISLFIATSSMANTTTEKIKVAFINPDIQGRPFWDLATEIALAAATDLNIELTVYYGGGDRFSNLALVEQLSSKPLKHDYLVFLPYKGKTKQQFQRLEQQGLPFVTLERSFEKKQLASLGLPQQQFKMWKTEVYFDDIRAGYLLAKALLTPNHLNEKLNLPPTNTMLDKHTDSTVKNIVAFSGDRSAIAHQRELGLKLALHEQSNARLQQIVHTLWQPNSVTQQLPTLLRRYPDTNVIWTASDELALAASKIVHRNINNAHVGGIDLTPKALKAIKTSDLTATVGGHFMQVAWALVKIHDLHKQQYSSAYDRLPYGVTLVTSANIEHYTVLTERPNWNMINFSRFSVSNKSETPYDFSLNRVIKQLKTNPIN
ncbi:ABC transporter substrate-binding protein [Algibacillus agarilyticus]|uniref:ABC transporter substrate-binding protein n=1 Tax=Algibacillus agarilyticus TaxID=2234133 RepID=UPI000DD0E724|nr:ABC transporter substrate-binding protein [Algibacillus agarilyticus]